MLNRYCLIILCLHFFLPAIAQKKLSITDSIPLNSAVRTGVLKNGLTYYILKKKDKNNIIALTLVNKVGAYHSKEGELGAAHFIEHVAFRSTENFPGGLMKFMVGLGLAESNGNAKTGPTSTQYILTVPIGDSAILNYGLLAMHDFAKGRLYLPEEVESEREAVINEMASADARRAVSGYLMFDKNPLFAPTLMAEEVQSYRVITADTLRRFDQKWYQPERQAVIIVGDIDENMVEQKVKSIFSTLKNEPLNNVLSEDILKKYDLPLTGRNKVVVANDGSNSQATQIRIFQKRKTITGIEGAATMQQLKVNLADEVYNELVRQRLAAMKPTKGLLLNNFYNAINRRIINSFAGIDALTTSINVPAMKDARAAIVFAMSELHRIEKWGFTKNELAIAKEEILKAVQQQDSQMSSERTASALKGYFVDHVAFPENVLELTKQLLNDISLAEINTMAATWIKQANNTDVLFLVTNENDPSIPGEKQVFSWIRDGLQAPVKPYVEVALKSLPVPPKEINRTFTRSSLTEIGATQIELPNAVKVIIKRLGSVKENTAPNQSDIVMTGFRAGGANLYNEKDYSSAAVAANLIRASGIASLTDEELENWLKNEKRNGNISAYPYITATEEGFGGQSSFSKVDQLLHLVYLYATQPRADRKIFNEKFIPNPDGAKVTKSKAELFDDSVLHVVVETIAARATGVAQFDKAFRIYKERFSNASGFTFVITGYFETEDIIKKAVWYLGALPGFPSLDVQHPNYKIKEAVKPPVIDPDLRVTMVDDSTGDVDVKMLFRGKLDLTVRNQLITNVARQVLNTVLYYRLREQEKGVYGANVGLNILDNTDKLSLRISYSTAPENVDRLVAAARDELHKIAEGKLSDDIFASALASERTVISQDLTGPNYVNMYISDQLRQKKMSLDGLNRLEILNKITKQDVINLMRDSLNKDHYMLFKLL